MGFPVICKEAHCHAKNSFLHDECRLCGNAISLDGTISRHFAPGQAVASAQWETVNIPDLWRSTAIKRDIAPVMDAHDLMGYALLLKAMASEFSQDDAQTWFDDALFFLRGGYEFFCFLNLSSPLTLRGRIFGGLNHALRPQARLEKWLDHLLAKATERGIATIDIFVGEEVDSGNGTNRFLKIIRERVKILATTAQYRVNAGPTIKVTFHCYLACTTNSEFNPVKFRQTVNKKGRDSYTFGRISINNRFKLFRGPLLAYDAEEISGLHVCSDARDPVELYECVKYTSHHFRICCKGTGKEVYLSYPGTNDIPNLISVFILEMTGQGGLGGISYPHLGERITRDGCEICKQLYAGLRASTDVWTCSVI